MTTYTKHDQGTFSWMELATTDAAAAKKFYGELFGWKFEDMPMGPGMTYTMCRVGDQTVGALYQMGKEMAAQMPPNWASYVTVNDVDAMTKTAVANGAKAIKEPFDVMEAGRMSVIADPAGAALCLWQAKKNPGAGMMGEPGGMCWHELYSTNVDATGKFYAQTFGWKPSAMDMGPGGIYTMFKRDGASPDENSVAGMMAMPPMMKGIPSNWLNYVMVTDVDASTKKVTELGGKVVLPVTPIPNMGKFSIVQDPAGATVGLFMVAK